jgi:hypothetical protein
MERGVPQDHISVMGKNFQSKTRIAGFISDSSYTVLEEYSVGFQTNPAIA